MQIKKRLQINIAVSALTVLVICLVLFLSLHQLNRANDSAKIAGEIITSMLERVTLRNDYALSNSARAKEQWFAKQKQIGGLLKSASENFHDTEDRKNIAELIDNHESIGGIFSAIVASRERNGLNPVSADLSREAEAKRRSANASGPRSSWRRIRRNWRRSTGNWKASAIPSPTTSGRPSGLLPVSHG